MIPEMKNRIPASRAFAAILVLCTAGPLLAKPFSKSGPGGGKALTLSATAFTDGDLESTGAGVSFRSVALEANTPLPWKAGPWRPSLAVGVERADYDFDRPERWTGRRGELLSGATAVRLAPSVAYRWSDTVSAFGGVSLQSSVAAGEDFSEGITVGVNGGVRRVISPQLAYVVGLAVSTRIEEDLKVIPLIGVEWTINPEWRLSVVGPRGRLAYKLTPTWTAFGQIAYESREWRLDDEAAIPAGVLRQGAVPASAGVEWALGPARLTATVGVPLAHEYRIDNRDGDKLFETDVEDSVAFGLSVRVGF
jgi:hypothetical protein